MKHLFAFPLLSLFIFVMWLLLNQSLGAGHVLLGALLGLSGSWLAAALLPAKARVRRPRVMLRLSVLVLVDIVRSNIAVARIILRPGQREARRRPPRTGDGEGQAPPERGHGDPRPTFGRRNAHRPFDGRRLSP